MRQPPRPPAESVLGTHPLRLTDLAVVCVPAVLGYLAVRLDHRLGRVYARPAEGTA
jgi:hypothetical protein